MWQHAGLRGLAIVIVLSNPASAFAACPIELSVYGDRDQAAEIDFTPVAGSAAVTNAFRMILDNSTVLDGMVIWTAGVERPSGALMYKCPEGDATGDELAACTLWEGVIYAADDKGNITLLPAEGADAPKTLIFPGLGPSLSASAIYGAEGFSKLPWDVFALKGCQE